MVRTILYLIDETDMTTRLLCLFVYLSLDYIPSELIWRKKVETKSDERIIEVSEKLMIGNESNY